MFSCGWLWMYAGAALMFLELLSPGFVVFFFGLSASTVGLMRFALGEALTPTWQLIAFSVLSILYLVFLRRWLRAVFSGDVETADTAPGGESVGRIGRVTAAIEPPKTGRVMLGDAEWTAIADAPVAAGADVRVTAQNNLTMKVEAI